MFRSGRVAALWFQALAAAGALAGCAERPAACAPGTGGAATVFALFFGESVPGRGDVTPAEWAAFEAQVLGANFPAGYTVADAEGAWRNPKTGATVREATKAVTVAMPPGRDSVTAANRVREAYKREFRQQSVGMTVSDGCGDF